ncbi:MAG: DUF4010 domain-containing protein [Gemmatimonadaceae bacterium]|uniref:MgtC/SapB family protein n=1 Tax=Gemmatimonas sp. UBA7669 TaxID=1946568 RepID=UPI0025C250CC|nr:DUF4010 domain-containing protein [Gemmatimonas sp. UBA7669]MBX9854835.1 DUF4010 domain-containing protein [Gemmatimonadaceae bacterium]
MTVTWTLPLRLLLALGLGLVVGLERETAKSVRGRLVFGGIRTEPLLALLGFAAACLQLMGVPFAVPAGFGAVAFLAALSYATKLRTHHPERSPGVSSELSGLLTFVVGALALLAEPWLAAALGIGNALLLSEKARLAALVRRLEKQEFLAALRFVLVTFIVLPILPDRSYPPFALNPADVWQLVILVASIGFVGYVLTRRLGERRGLTLVGLVGGLLSSTVLTVSMARRARAVPAIAADALRAAVLAASVMYVRLLTFAALLDARVLPALSWRLALLGAIGAALAPQWERHGVQPSTEDTVGTFSTPSPRPASPRNPFELGPALAFAAVFVLLSVGTATVRARAGSTGVMAVAAVAGAVEVDPFILAMLRAPDAPVTQVVAAILIATLTNTVAKGAYFAALVPARRRAATWRYGVWALAHVPLLLGLR